MRILVVDDEPDNVDLLRFVLEAAGHVVASSSTARGAIEAERAADFDVVLLDLSLPGELDGIDVVRSIRTEGRNASTPVLAVTAFSDPAIHARAIAEGCNRTFTKPILDLLAFVREVEHVVRTHTRSRHDEGSGRSSARALEDES